MAGRATPIFVPREAVQQAQQGLQYANAFLIERAGLSPAAASAVIGGTLAIPTGGWGVALAASGAFISTEILETETAQRAVGNLAAAFIDLGVSPETAYQVSGQIIGVGVGVAVGFGIAGAARGVASGLAQLGGKVTIYRGIARGHPGYRDATRGIVKPRGGHDNPYLHNEGNTRSEFASWTTNRAVAERFAEGDGVVLQMRVDKSKLTVSPDRYGEGEVLLQGPVQGAKVYRINRQ